MRSIKWCAIAAICVAGGAVLWNAHRIHAWWTVRQLACANAESRQEHVSELAALGEAAIAPLLDGLASADADGCKNLEKGLETVCADWSADDPRLACALETLADQFPRMAVDGKRTGLQFAAFAARRSEDPQAPLPSSLDRALAQLLAAAQKEAPLRSAGLVLATEVLARGPAAQWGPACRETVLSGFGDADMATRRAAVQLALREPLATDRDVLGHLVPLLRDSDALIRRRALVALGPLREIAPDEELLPLLHDADTEVQHLCALALRSRGLTERQLDLARLVSDPDPSMRLRVLPLLRTTTELDPEAWLRRLSTDPAPAVRAAAIRMAGPTEAGLRERIEEMARTDPSSTVREIARYYLDRSKIRRAGFGGE